MGWAKYHEDNIEIWIERNPHKRIGSPIFTERSCRDKMISARNENKRTSKNGSTELRMK